MHHAILLHGKKGIGKSSFAKDFVNQITGVIPNNPDLLFIKKNDGKRDIVVDQIREIADFVNQTAAISKSKFIIIDAADDLNKSGANALLKILEEPHKNNFLILISHLPGKLLPTIRSRCQAIQVADLSFEDFAKILQENHPSALPKLKAEEIKFLGAICDNSPSYAIKKGDDLVEIYQEFLNSLADKKLSEIILKKLADKNFDFEIIAKVIIFFLYRLSLVSQGLLKDLFFNEEEVFAASKLISNPKNLLEISVEIDATLNKIIFLNLDKRLALLNIFNQLII